jgi:hypothetical protein
MFHLPLIFFFKKKIIIFKEFIALNRDENILSLIQINHVDFFIHSNPTPNTHQY